MKKKKTAAGDMKKWWLHLSLLNSYQLSSLLWNFFILNDLLPDFIVWGICRSGGLVCKYNFISCSYQRTQPVQILIPPMLLWCQHQYAAILHDSIVICFTENRKKRNQIFFHNNLSIVSLHWKHSLFKHSLLINNPVTVRL